MSTPGDILDISKIPLEGDFDSQVQILLSTVRLTRAEVESLQELILDLKQALKRIWKVCTVYPFGSIVTGLGIRTSDIDCYVSLADYVHTPHNKRVIIAKQALMHRPDKFAEVFAIPMAKVPIVKFYHLPTDRNCDVNFNSVSGVQNSRLLAYLLHVDPRALPLAILIKYWSKVHKLTGTNLVPNYALTLMVVFYLQHVNILPPVHLLQQPGSHYMVDKWNTAFEEIQFKNDDDLSLYQLLGGFFDYYANFDYQTQVIIPYLGCPIQKDCFNKLDDVPDELDLYKINVSKNNLRPLRTDSEMCVQDPFEHCRNCTVAVRSKLFIKFIRYIKNAAKMFYEEQCDAYLKAIMTPCQQEEEPKKEEIHSKKIEKPRQHNGVQKNIRKNVRLLYDEYCKRKGKHNSK